MTHSELGNVELLQIEIETIWGLDDCGRIAGPDLVVACSSMGWTTRLGTRVPDGLAAVVSQTLADAVSSSLDEVNQPPSVLDACRRLLEPALGPLELTPGSGPSYLIPDMVAFASTADLARSNETNVSDLLGANPGNWQADEWEQLLAGRLGPWVMATQHGEVVSICHTPACGARGAEAGVWTRPDLRGRGLAAAVTAAWAALMRPTGRHLFYSTSRTNVSSQRVASRLALRPLGWLWQLSSPQPQRGAVPKPRIVAS